MKLLVIFLGMVASGKSTLAQAWALKRKVPYYNTDRVRKELAGLQPTDKRPDDVGQGIYSAELSSQTYQVMLERVRQDFNSGKTEAVLDGSYGRRVDRDRVRRMAADTGAQCVFVFCVCSEREVQRRLACREQDPQAVSDGRWEIYLHQQEKFEMPDETESYDSLRLNTEREADALLAFLAENPLLRSSTHCN